MRLNKLFIATLLAFSTLALQSCLKDQEDFFDESSSERMQAVLENTKAVLTSSDNGWIFDYYPDRNLSYGGCVYVLKFDNKNVSARYEIEPDLVETSSYKLNTNNGPVLSFDSYNSLLHYFATPSSGEYQAKDGDFEFMIMNVTEDLITLRGNRTGNTMYLRRLNEDPDAFVHAIGKIYDTNVLPSANGSVGANAITCKNDINAHYMEFFWGGDNSQSSGEYYLSTSTGIRFKNPVTVNGATISELNYTFDDSNKSGAFTGEDSNGNSISLSGVLPETYAFFNEFKGSFTFSYANGAKNVNCTLVPDKVNGIITISGLNRNYDLIATYNRSLGCMELCGQVVAVTSDSQILFMGGTSSSFYAKSSVGFFFIKNPQNPTHYEIMPNNDPYSSKCNNSFVIIESADKYYIPPTSYRINGDYNISNVKAFIKN